MIDINEMFDKNMGDLHDAVNFVMGHRRPRPDGIIENFLKEGFTLQSDVSGQQDVYIYLQKRIISLWLEKYKMLVRYKILCETWNEANNSIIDSYFDEKYGNKLKNFGEDREVFYFGVTAFDGFRPEVNFISKLTEEIEEIKIAHASKLTKIKNRAQDHCVGFKGLGIDYDYDQELIENIKGTQQFNIVQDFSQINSGIDKMLEEWHNEAGQHIKIGGSSVWEGCEYYNTYYPCNFASQKVVDDRSKFEEYINKAQEEYSSFIKRESESCFEKPFYWCSDEYKNEERRLLDRIRYAQQLYPEINEVIDELHNKADKIVDLGEDTKKSTIEIEVMSEIIPENYHSDVSSYSKTRNNKESV